MATTINDIKNKIGRGAKVGQPFNLTGTNPNFSRDSLSSIEELSIITINDTIYDVGHIVYCEEDENHYVFRGTRTGTPADGWVGHFQKWSMSGGVGGSIFQFKGNLTSLEDIPSDVTTGWVYRIAVDSITISSGQSATGNESIAYKNDVIACVEKGEDSIKWSIIENTITGTGLIRKDTTDGINYAEGDVAVFSDTQGESIKSTGVKIDDVVLVEKTYNTDLSSRGADLFENTKENDKYNTNVPILNDNGNLVDSKVSITILRNLQKELGGTEITTLDENPVKGTLADIIKSYRQNNYRLGSTYDTISATTEEQFVGDIQTILSANTSDAGFTLPIVAIKSEDSLNSYMFQEFIPSGMTEMTVEATLRKDGKIEDDYLFHVDFEIAKYSLQYWYFGSDEESVLYFVDYGMSGNLNSSQEQQNNGSEEP